MEDYYEYLDSNGVTTLYKLIKDDTVALINEYSVTINGITTTLDTHTSNSDIHTPIADIENMVDTKISGLVNSAPETLDTLKELSDALGNDPNFATTVANQIGTKADKASVYSKEDTNTLLGNKANSVHTHVVNDITGFPTIPTKLSQLENDMGFGTGSGGSGDTSDCVHKTGDETIGGDKSFSKPIYRKADITKSTVAEVYRLTDTNATPCGSIYNRMHWYNNNVYNRHQAYNATSDKDMYLEILSHNDGSGVVNTGGSVTNNKNLTTVTSATGHTAIATMGWVNNPETSTNVVHRSGNEHIAGNKMFTGNLYKKNSNIDLQVNPSTNHYNSIIFTDKNNAAMVYLEHIQTTAGINIIGVYARDKSNGTHGIQITSENNIKPLKDNTYSLGISGTKWKSVYATTYYGNLVGGITLNQTSLKMTVKDSNSDTTRTIDVLLANSSNTGYGINVAFGGSGNTVVGAGESYTAQLNELVGNSQENLFLTADNNIFFKVGANTFADAKTVTLNTSAELSGLAKVTATSFVGALTGNVTGNCSGSSSSCTGNAATATTATKSTTQANTDNSTNIATTAWVRTYVNSVVGSNTVGSSVSAYWSNSSNVTATGNASATNGYYPAGYSEYITNTPVVGTIYSGAQLYTELNAYASAKGTVYSSGQYSTYTTSVTAQATFSNPISSTGKYLCTTANTVRFRGYAPGGNSVGTASVIENTSTKSIFIRIE